MALCTLLPLGAGAQRVEYFWDTDPGVGKGLVLQQFSGSEATVQQSLDVSRLHEGVHQLGLRTLNGHYASATYYRTFYIPQASHKVQAIEYFFDSDPGTGRGTRIAASTAGADSLQAAFDIDTYGLPDGEHLLGLRVLTDQTWSETKWRRFLQRTKPEDHVVRVEYFWDDDDPGAGRGYVVDVPTTGSEVTVSFEIDPADQPEGQHTLSLRAMSGMGIWSAVERETLESFEGWDNLQAYLNSLRDSEDRLAGSEYSREYPNREWQALYVPFTMNYDDWADHFDVARINAFYQYDDDEDGVVDRQVLEAILVKPGNGSLKPNHPYLIRARQTGSYQLHVSPSMRVAEQVNNVSCSTLEAQYTFTGSYTSLTGLKTAQRYRLRGGALSIPDNDDEVLPPYRWYLTIDDLGNQLQPQARRVSLRVLGDDSEATGIADRVQEGDEAAGRHGAFDMSGRRVSLDQDGALPPLKKGVYIINHKKYIAK